MGIFRRLVTSIVNQLDCTHLLAACDLPGGNFRHQLSGDYKAQRSPAPDGMSDFIAAATDAIRAAGIPLLSAPGFEADDVLATIACKMRPGHELVIVSSDRDLAALVSEQVRLLIVKSGGNHQLIGPQNASDVFGVSPALITDYKALVGDSSDNISGVTGIGPKTAVKLLHEHGSLDAILANAHTIAGAAGKKLTNGGAAQAQLSRQLAAMRSDVPITLDAAAAVWTAEKRTAFSVGQPAS